MPTNTFEIAQILSVKRFFLSLINAKFTKDLIIQRNFTSDDLSM